MNPELQPFIDQARQRGIDDAQIIQLLVDQGWQEPTAKAAVYGLTVPSPQSMPVASQASTDAVDTKKSAVHHRPSLGALEAALQHVLLWVFTFATTVALGFASFALFGSSSDSSSETLLTFLVVELVTFVPFVVFFTHYLRKQKATPELGTNKIWSIITIVFHSVGLMSALVSLLLTVILVQDDTSMPILAWSSAVAAINAAVVVAYVTANFAKIANSTKRMILIGFPIALFVIILIFSLLALSKVGPLRADDETRQQLVEIVEAVKDHTEDSASLPESLSVVSVDASGVTYRKISTSTYELCAVFNVGGGDGYYGSSESPVNDDYVSDYDFSNEDSGENCFVVESWKLQEDMRGY